MLALMFDQFIIFGAKYLIWLAVGVALVWFLKQSKPTQKKVFILGLVCLPVAYAIAKIVSLFYYHPQPFVVENFTPLIPHDPDNGFPSDHTLLAAALAAVIFPFSKKVSGLAWLLTILIGIARVLGGIHYPVDIAGSIAIAIMAGVLIYHVLLSRFNQRRD